MMKSKTFLLILSFLIFLICCGVRNQVIGSDIREAEIKKRLIEFVNEMRIKGATCGDKYYKTTHPVVWNDRLGQASLNHSLDMAENGFLSHIGSDGKSSEERLLKVGYRWMTYGENVGEGYKTPEELVKGWLKSTSHCKIIMNPTFKEAGAACVKGSRKIYWTLILASPER